MNFILTQLYIIAFVCLLICRTGIIRWVKFKVWGAEWAKHSIKPFDCPLCLTFWVSLAIDCYLYTIPVAIGQAAINALIASELEKYLRK